MGNRRAICHIRAACAHAFVVAFSILAGAVPANAALVQFALFRSGFFTQSSNAQPTTATTWAINSRGFVDNLTDFTAMNTTGPGPTLALSPFPGSSPAFWESPSPQFPTLAALDTTYPAGTYTITGTPPNGNSTFSLSYTQDAFPTTIPFVTNFSSLQGFDPTKAFTFNWNTYGAGSIANESDIFFTIFNQAQTQVLFSQSFLPSTTTSLVLPANTLLSNTSYFFSLDFSNRIDSPSPARLQTVQGFDLVTGGAFTTGAAAIPEPSTLVMGLSAGLIGLATWGLTFRRWLIRHTRRPDTC